MDNWLHSECQGVDLSGSSGASAQYQGLVKILNNKEKGGGGSVAAGGGSSGSGGGGSGGGEGGGSSDGGNEGELKVVFGGIQKVCVGMTGDVQGRRQGVQGLVDLVHGLVEEDSGRYRDFVAVRHMTHDIRHTTCDL